MEMKYSEAFARVEKEEDYIVDILRKIIAVDTSVPPGENYSKLLDIVEPEFQKFNFETQRVVVPEEKVAQIPYELSGERCNLVASMKNGKPKASVYAHMDVVPVDEPWTVDPFAGIVKDGKLYGRGTVDMKGSIACCLGAVKVLHELGIEPHYELDCLLCTDEEIGVYPGSRYLVDERYEDVVAEIQEAVKRGRKKSKLMDLKINFNCSYGPVEIDPQSPASIKMRAAATAVKGYTDFVFGGMSASTDLAMVADALKPEKLDVAGFGLVRAKDIRVHAADEFVYLEDLVSMTKELVHYFAF